MMPSNSLHPSQQLGLHSVQPSLPAVTTASAPNQFFFNIGHPVQPCNLSQPAAYALQPTARPPQPSYPEPSYPPQQFAPVYPSLPPAPVPQYPSIPEKSYPPTPAVVYHGNGGSTFSAQPNHSQSSYHHAWTPLSSAPLNHYQLNSSYPYPALIPSSVSNPKQDSEAGDQSSSNPSQKSHSQDSNVAQESPTVRPVTPFNPQADAQVLRKAMKGFISIDKKVIINILIARSNKQRLEIAFRYKNMYDKNLITALQNEFTVSGCFLDLMRALLMPLPEFLATEVFQAITGGGSNERTLVEILCTASNVEIDAIKAEYERLYCRPLEKDLAIDNCGNFERVLAYMVQVRRPENNDVDEAAATQDAQSLVTAGVLRMDLAKHSFVSVLCTRSYAHLRRVFKVYKQISGKPLEYAVSSQFTGNVKKGLLAIIQCVEDKAAFFADRIYDATSARGSKDRELIRVIVSRCEIDLQTIKETYQKRYGKRMELDISKAVDGHYKKTLLALVGGYY